MKISFEKKVFLGFVINLLVVIAGWIFISRLIIKETKRWIRYWTVMKKTHKDTGQPLCHG
jgi:hypothetical protein